MRQRVLLHEELNRLQELAGESLVAGKHLVVVDIQPEYLDGCKHFLRDFINFLNLNNHLLSNLTFMYNGANTVGHLTDDSYRDWWLELGLDEAIVDTADFYDKGYAFFRFCMDEGIAHEATTNLVRFMLSHNINDSRDITKEFWDAFIEEYGDHDVRELMEVAGDCVSIPELIDEVRHYNNIVLCGGHVDECLKEVEIALDAINKPYRILTKYTY